MTQQTKSPYTRPSKRHQAHSYAAPKPDRRKCRYTDEDEWDLDPSTGSGHGDGDSEQATRPAPDYDPAAAIPEDERLVVRGKRYFKLAPHQRVIEAHLFSRFGVLGESEYGFKVLRDPRTGHPVVRDHGDLKPGEISLVLE